MKTAPTFLAIIAVAAATCFHLRYIPAPLSIETGQFKRGYFEYVDGRASLVLVDTGSTKSEISAGYTLTRDGGLGLWPGSTAAVTLKEVDELSITTPAAGMAPYVVLGREVPLVESRPSAGPPATVLADALVPHTAFSALDWREWNASAPWRDDEERLRRIAAACGVTGGGAALHVLAAPARLEVRYGTCTSVKDVSGVRSPLTLAIVSGPDVSYLKRAGGVWRTARHIESNAAAGIVLCLGFVAGILVVSIFPPAVCLSLALASLFASYFSPFYALLGWLAVMLGSGVTRVFRAAMALAKGGPGPGLKEASLAVLGLSVSLLPVVAAWGAAAHLRVTGTRGAAAAALAGGAGCILTGYSTMAGAGLRGRHTQGMGGLIGQSCPPCHSSVYNAAEGGGTFESVRDLSCALGRSGTGPRSIIFLGGFNDDYNWGILHAAREGGPVFLKLVFAMLEMTVSYLEPGNDAAARYLGSLPALEGLSERHFGKMRDSIREAAGCAVGGGMAFTCLHDFAVWDLAGGRSDARQRMLAGRRKAVESAGGTFIDLLEANARDAGVAWFNDFVHFSVIGHAAAARYACGAPR